MQRTTLFLLIIALSLGGYIYIYEIQPNEEEEVANQEGRTLFSFEEEQVQRLKITTEDKKLEFIRNDENAEIPWQMKQPEDIPADEAPIVFLLDLLIKEQSSRTFKVENLEEYGLAEPFATIEFQLNNDQKKTVTLGKSTFNEKKVYAQINPNKDNAMKVDIVSMDFRNAVNRSLSEWKHPSQSPEQNSQESES